MGDRLSAGLGAAAIAALCGLLWLARRPDPPPPPQPLPPECVQGLGWMAQALASEVDRATRARLDDLSRADEVRLGQRLLALGAEKTPIHAGWTAYAQTVLDRLLAAFPEHRFPYTITVWDSPEWTGGALPGGALTLNRGLLRDQIHDEAELAVAIGHELAHVELGHAAGVWGYLASFPELRDDESLALARYGFSATRELEADRLGLSLARFAGYDPRAGERLWRRDWPPPAGPSPLLPLVLPWLERLDSAEARDTLRQLAERAGVSAEEPAEDLAILLATHPPPAVRACVMAATAAQLDARLGPADYRGQGAFADARAKNELSPPPAAMPH